MSPVPAAPNRCRLNGTVQSASELEPGGRRRLLLTIGHLEPVAGGLFAHPGDVVEVYCFGEVAEWAQAGSNVSADAEFIGGPGRKLFRIPPAGRP